MPQSLSKLWGLYILSHGQCTIAPKGNYTGNYQIELLILVSNKRLKTRNNKHSQNYGFSKKLSIIRYSAFL